MADTSHLRSYVKDPNAITTIGSLMTLRMNTDQIAWLRNTAKRLEMNVSWYVRFLVSAEMNRQKKMGGLKRLTLTPKRIITRRVAKKSAGK